MTNEEIIDSARALGIDVDSCQAVAHEPHHTGMRAMELAGLRVGDVLDLGTGAVREVVRLPVTKGDRFREVFVVGEEVRDSLARYLKTRPKRDGAPLFLSQKGGGFTPDTMQKLLHTIYAKAGIAASSHSGRRTFATRALQAGANIYDLMEMLGHAHLSTTQRYLTTSPERLKAIARLL